MSENVSENIIEVSDSSFETDVLEKSKEMPVIVDFWASWCMPCRMLSPTLDKVATKHNGKIILAKLNVDENPEVSGKFDIMSIPSVKLFRNGEIVDEFVGALPEAAVNNWLSEHL